MTLKDLFHCRLCERDVPADRAHEMAIPAGKLAHMRVYLCDACILTVRELPQSVRDAKTQVGDLVMLLKRLYLATAEIADERIKKLRAAAWEYIEREGLEGSILRCKPKVPK